MPEVTKISLPVLGLACAACAQSVQSILETSEGVVSATVNYGNKTLRLEYSASIISLPEIRDKVQSIGYDLLIEEDNKTDRLEIIEKQRFKKLKLRLIVALCFGIPVFVLSMFFHSHSAFFSYWSLLLSVPVVFYSGSEFYLSAFRQSRYLIFSMDSLVTTGTLVAFLYSMFHTFFPAQLKTGGMPSGLYYESAVVIIMFVLLGRFLEDRARRSASASLRKLGGLQPKVVTIERENESFDLPFSLILPGDKVSVKPGDKIPVDGTIVSGYSIVDESSISGEPLPVPKEAGQFVYAGTLNQSGLLLVKAEKPGNDTLLAQIIRLVDEAQSSKPPIQKLVDKITQYFVPSIFLIAIITFISWLILGSLNQAIISAVSVLIIACPCALGLATPAALVAGMGRGAKEGLLIRNSSALETASHINVLFLDKTGTLTSGTPRVNNIHWKETPEVEYWNTILMLESASSHPLAAAITSYIKDQPGIGVHQTEKADIFEEKAGQGIYAVVNGIEWRIGSAGFLNDQGINLPNTSEQGVTKVYVLRNHELVADLSISDNIRPDAANMVHHLKRQGIEPVMVSGDSQAAAEHIARQAGIDRVYAGILPDQKGELVKKYQSEGYKVAMIGDGINDAYALAQADLAFAMGSGSDIAMESASIVLIKSSLSNVIKSLVLSKALIRIIRQNLFWAFFYNIIAIPLAAGIFYPFTGYMLDPMIAGAAMAMSSITVVGNSLRLRKIKLLLH